MNILDEPGDDDWEFDTPVQEAIHDSHLESSSSIAARFVEPLFHATINTPNSQFFLTPK